MNCPALGGMEKWLTRETHNLEVLVRIQVPQQCNSALIIKQFDMKKNEPANQPGYPKYKSHKEVRAFKIGKVDFDADVGGNRETDGSVIITPENTVYPPFKVDGEFDRRHAPQPGGYIVFYEDGYVSYSPADAFEGGYTLGEQHDLMIRLNREKDDLLEKLKNLHDFLNSEKAPSLKPLQFRLLTIQLKVMQAYSDILQLRIENMD